MSSDDDIRETLQRRAADATISADAWRRIETRIAAGESGGNRSGPPEGPGRRRVTLLAAAAVLVVIAASLALLSSDDDQKVKTGPADGGASTTTSASDPSPTTSLSTTTSGVPSSSTSGSTPTDPSTTTSTSTSTEPPPPVAQPVGDWKLTMVGIGPIEVGMTMEEASQASGLNFQLTRDSFIGSNMDGCGYPIVDDAPDGLHFTVNERRIVDVGVTGGGFTTVSGMGIGNTEQEVQATYDGIVVSPHQYVDGGHYLSYSAPGDPTHLLLFETDGNVVTSFRSGIAGWVRAPEGCA